MQFELRFNQKQTAFSIAGRIRFTSRDEEILEGAAKSRPHGRKTPSGAYLGGELNGSPLFDFSSQLFDKVANGDQQDSLWCRRCAETIGL